MESANNQGNGRSNGAPIPNGLPKSRSQDCCGEPGSDKPARNPFLDLLALQLQAGGKKGMNQTERHFASIIAIGNALKGF